MRNLFLVFMVLFSTITVSLMATETQDVNVEQLKVAADSIASKSINALNIIESNVDLINDIMDKNVSSVVERLSVLTDKFGNKIFTKEQIANIGKKIEELGVYAWFGAKEGFKLFTLYVVMRQILSFGLISLMFIGLVIIFKKVWKLAMWDDDTFNVYAVVIVLVSIALVVLFVMIVVYFAPFMMAIFVPKIFAVTKLLSLIGIII